MGTKFSQSRKPYKWWFWKCLQILCGKGWGSRTRIVCWISGGCVRIHTSWLSMICNCLRYIAMYPFFLVIEYAVSWLFKKIKKDKKDMREKITCVDVGLLDFRQWCSSLSIYIYIYISQKYEGVKSGLFEPLSHKWIPRLPSGLS